MGSVLGLKRSKRETDHFVRRGVKVRSALKLTASLLVIKQGDSTLLLEL
jgi:hypothetical protein